MKQHHMSKSAVMLNVGMAVISIIASVILLLNNSFII